jgi:hypothetical protein
LINARIGWISIDRYFSPPFFASVTCKEDSIPTNIVTTAADSVAKTWEICLNEHKRGEWVFDSEKFYPVGVKILPVDLNPLREDVVYLECDCWAPMTLKASGFVVLPITPPTKNEKANRQA